jgi:hypothetical protein
MSTREIPPVTDLTFGQCQGWACVWCRVRLTVGAVSAGIARGRSGAHVLDTEVYACPDCAAHPGLTTTLSTGDAS